MNIRGKVAIVSGAAQGLGRHLAERLVAEGCQVLAFDRQENIPTIDNATTMLADVSLREDVERVVAAAQEIGEIGVLINNAGAWKRTPVDGSWDAAVSDWSDIMDTNLKGVMLLSRAVVPYMKSGGGHIINISSYYVLPAKTDGTNPLDTDLYNASKWALNGFTDAWAKSLARFNIHVNGMCMGAVDTPMLRGLFPGGKLPEGLDSAVMQPGEMGNQMMDIMTSGRTGENFGAWPGEPATLGSLPPLHHRITGTHYSSS